MKLKKVAKALFYKITQRHQDFVDLRLCGIPLKVHKHSVRRHVDQDDAWWFYLCKHHDVIFDIGANVGYTALLALIQQPNRQILLVDPNPEALKIAATTIINNGLGGRAQYLSAFVGDQLDQQLKFYTIGAGAAGSMYASHATSAAAINSFIDVKTVTLDYLFEFYGLQPELVKIDVEGAETLVMKAAKNMAKQCQCTFFIEMHDVEDLGMKAAGDLMVAWCKEMDYEAWYLKKQTQLLSGDAIADRGKCHLLLLPKGTQYPDYLKDIVQKSELPKSI